MTDRLGQHDTALLSAFLHERDTPCPQCSYNLRNLTTDVCPECDEPLRLAVGSHHARCGWFIATLTPGLFSGIAAVLLLTLVGAAEIMGGGPIPPVVWLLGLIGLASGAVAGRLLVRRQRFLELRTRVQRKWALVIWALHAAPFIGLLVLVILTA